MSYPRLKNKRVLLVEDTPSWKHKLHASLEDVGCEVTAVGDVATAVTVATSAALARKSFHVAIIDLYIPHAIGDPEDHVMRGEELGMRLRDASPSTVLCSISSKVPGPLSTDVIRLFQFHVSKDDIPKNEPPTILLENLEAVFFRAPRIFIVHGHDEPTLNDLKDYLSTTLQLGDPVVLRDTTNSGRTIIEKFEREAKSANFVFVLATPDDAHLTGANSQPVYRARQNVIFELGYFYASLRRTSGRVIVLKKGAVELPSDIHGVVWIDISQGISAVDDEIRKELKDYL